MSGTAESHTETGERICWKCGRHFGTEVDNCPDDGSRLIAVSAGDLADPMIGTLFDGRYRIYKKLGEGGMGNVYSARQVDFERDVALKILKADFLRDENIRKRFMYEARTISNLRHPHALRLFDFGQAPDGSFYMVMELLEGESLADRLAYAFVRFRDVFNIVPPVCGVLFEAHENHVVHRDLKPENIFLVEVNKRAEFTKLLDFGIAKHLQDRTMTRSGTLWGTPAYMSPEQARGDTVGAPADIYGIGIILFELISGNLPFSSETQMGLAMKHINVPARPLRSIPGLADVVPQELDDLVMSCLSKIPEERPSDAEEVASQLLEIRNSLFDEERLDVVPAEEVDAIALQDWIAAEPDVSDEAPIMNFGHPMANTMTPPPTSADLDQARAGLRYSDTSTLSSDELRAVGERPQRGVGLGIVALLMLVVGIAVGFAILGGGDEREKVVEVRPQTPANIVEVAAGTAGTAAASAAGVVLVARQMSGAIEEEDALAADIAREPPKVAPEPPPKVKELEEAKPAIERTF